MNWLRAWASIFDLFGMRARAELETLRLQQAERDHIDFMKWVEQSGGPYWREVKDWRKELGRDEEDD